MNFIHSVRDWIVGTTRLIPTWARVTAILLFILLIAGSLAAYKWDWLQSAGSGLEESNSTTLRNVGLLLGGFIAVILAIWRSSVAERQAKAALDQAVVAQTQATTAQESLRHDRYQRGAAMLGSELLPVKLAGISALKRLAADYPEEYHIQIMNFFCGIVRDATQDYASNLEGNERTQRLRDDVQAVMNVIGYRCQKMRDLEKRGGFEIDLRGADLRGAKLDGANLSGANLAEVKLSRARMTRANLSNADMWFADLSCSSEVLINQTFLDVAQLDDVNLMYANLSGVRFQGARLTRARLLEANMSKTFLYRASLLDADISLADLSGAILTDANISGQDYGKDTL